MHLYIALYLIIATCQALAMGESAVLTTTSLSKLPDASKVLKSFLINEPLIALMRSRPVFLSGIQTNPSKLLGVLKRDGLEVPVYSGEFSFSNDSLQYPADQMPLERGRKRWLSDLYWSDVIQATEKLTPHQAGFKAELMLFESGLLKLMQLSYCQTINSCERLGIPFISPKKPPASKTWRDFLHLESCETQNVIDVLRDLPQQDSIYRFALARLLYELGQSKVYQTLLPVDVPITAPPSALETRRIISDSISLYTDASRFWNMAQQSKSLDDAAFDCLILVPSDEMLKIDLRRVLYLRARVAEKFAGLRLEYLRHRNEHKNLLPARREIVSLTLCLSQADCEDTGIVGKK